MHTQLIKKAELEQAQKNASQANESFTLTQYEVNKDRIIAGERVGWFCAGAISLSFTLIGYLFSNSGAKQVLTGNIFRYIPLIQILILGWLNLLISVLASLLVRMWNASYLNYNKAQYWTSKNKESKEKALEAIEAGVEIIFTDVQTQDQAIKNILDSKNNYADLERTTTRRAKFWLHASNLAQASIYVGAIIGLLFLSIFLMIVTYRLAYL